MLLNGSNSKSGTVLNHSKTVLCLCIFIPIVACAQRGDFGRLKQNPSDSDITSSIGKSIAWVSGKYPHSSFEYTQKERRMHDLGFRLLAPLGQGTRRRDLVSLTRTHAIPEPDEFLISPHRYYKELRKRVDKNSYSIWTIILQDMEDDRSIARRFITAANSVIDQDRNRRRELKRISPGYEDLTEDTIDRIAENNNYIKRVGRTFKLRLNSYKYAIDHAALEVPSEDLYTAQLLLPELRKMGRKLSHLKGSRYGSRQVISGRYEYEPTVINPPIIDESLQEPSLQVIE